MLSDSLNDQIDLIVAEFSDAVQEGPSPDPAEFLQRIPAQHRPALQRCLEMIHSGQVMVAGHLRALGPGVVLDGYRIEREIGRGGMAVVYLAEQLDLRRKVALKVLRPGLAIDARHVDRFRREAMAVARLQHPHIVQIHAVGQADGHHYLSMEYIEGQSLAQVVLALPSHQPWTAADLARAIGIPVASVVGRNFESAMAELLVPVVQAIAVAHQLDIVHRDIKPSNILVRRDGRATVADFGLAKGEQDPALSMTGEPLGTPYYMSPEQAAWSDQRVDARSDIYSLGVTLFECLSGARPIEGKTTYEVLEAIRLGVPKSLRATAPQCSAAAEAVVSRAMAFRREDRYGTASDLAADLSALAQGCQTQALALRGGWIRRWFAALGRISRGQGFEYLSRRQFLGLPLVHINFRRRLPGQRRIRVARAWVAMADLAIGGVAVGPLALGVVGLGSIGVGLLGLGGLAAGGCCFGGAAVGLLATGGVALGYAAAGGLAVGHYALGGVAAGSHIIDGMTPLAARAESPVFEFMAVWMPWVTSLLP